MASESFAEGILDSSSGLQEHVIRRNKPQNRWSRFRNSLTLGRKNGEDCPRMVRTYSEDYLPNPYMSAPNTSTEAGTSFFASDAGVIGSESFAEGILDSSSGLQEHVIRRNKPENRWSKIRNSLTLGRKNGDDCPTMVRTYKEDYLRNLYMSAPNTSTEAGTSSFASDAGVMASESFAEGILDSSSDSQEHVIERKKSLNRLSRSRFRNSFTLGRKKGDDCPRMVRTYSEDYLPNPHMSAPNTSTEADTSRNIADYAPDMPPFVPPLLTECITEVEFRGLDKKFLYRRNGDVAEAESLAREYLANKKVPNLERVNIHTITLIIKIFLTSLREPLITDELYDVFLRASLIPVKKERDTELCEAMWNLPPSNRDTLAYLIHHLWNVNVKASSNIIGNLAFVFRHILIRQRSSDYFTPFYFIAQRDHRTEIIESLLKMNDCEFIYPLSIKPLWEDSPSESTTPRDSFDGPDYSKLSFDVTTRE